MYSRVVQKTAISGTGGSKIPWLRAKESLSDVELEKIVVFWFCSSPDPAIIKKTFRGFSEILSHDISYEFT